MAPPLLQKRLFSGLLLSALLLALLLTDLFLSSLTPPQWVVPGTKINLAHWLYNGAISSLLVLGFTWMAARELVNFARNLGFRPLGKVAQVFSAGMVLAPFVAFNFKEGLLLGNESWGVLWMAMAVGFSFFMQAVRRGTENAMVNIACTQFIILYAGGFAGFLTKLRMEVGGPRGMLLMLLSVLIVKMTDTGAYFFGSWFGKHKMVPWLSPKKTWEGFVGGILTAVAVAWICAVLLERNGIPVGPVQHLPFAARVLLLGVSLALFSVAGDLCASLLKRDAAVKDSGDSLPGLGGILDVLDSPLLAAPAAWFFWTRLTPLP